MPRNTVKYYKYTYVFQITIKPCRHFIETILLQDFYNNSAYKNIHKSQNHAHMLLHTHTHSVSIKIFKEI